MVDLLTNGADPAAVEEYLRDGNRSRVGSRTAETIGNCSAALSLELEDVIQLLVGPSNLRKTSVEDYRYYTVADQPWGVPVLHLSTGVRLWLNAFCSAVKDLFEMGYRYLMRRPD
ncbi:hypothetical protein C8R44DRAFT_958893 [Mycena epipterygia]|nr:hypothetical protein C8R44DRAFT_958893 [Mycena epipterygia]